MEKSPPTRCKTKFPFLIRRFGPLSHAIGGETPFYKLFVVFFLSRLPVMSQVTIIYAERHIDRETSTDGETIIRIK